MLSKCILIITKLFLSMAKWALCALCGNDLHKLYSRDFFDSYATTKILEPRIF